MLAAVLKDFNNLVLEEVPTPTPGPGEVLVRIKSCGFCATDYKAIKGIRRNVTFPLIPGHEPSGVIAAVGPGVTHFKEGDEVICQPSGYCGVCEACRMGNTHYCEHAYTTGGDGPEDVRPGDRGDLGPLVIARGEEQGEEPIVAHVLLDRFVQSREQVLVVLFDGVGRLLQGRQALVELRHRPPQGPVLLPIL